MTERPRRKWAEIQVDLFKDATRRHADGDSRARFEELFARMVPPIRPRGQGATSPGGADGAMRDAPRGAAGTPTDHD